MVTQRLLTGKKQAALMVPYRNLGGTTYADDLKIDSRIPLADVVNRKYESFARRNEKSYSRKSRVARQTYRDTCLLQQDVFKVGLCRG